MFLVQPMLMAGQTIGAVNIENHTIDDITAGPTCTVEYILGNNGVASETTDTGGNVPYAGEWLVSGSVSDFEVMATENSGSVTTGPIGTWESLSSTQTWTLERNTSGTSTCELGIQIRRVVDETVLDSATITLQAEIS